MVHDGLPGNPEVDYQQGLDLKAYWDQFFDRESGVFFYQYYVNTSCADKSVFGLDLANDTKVSLKMIYKLVKVIEIRNVVSKGA